MTQIANRVRPPPGLPVPKSIVEDLQPQACTKTALRILSPRRGGEKIISDGGIGENAHANSHQKKGDYLFFVHGCFVACIYYCLYF